MADQYKLTVYNKSGANAQVAVYQNYPSLTGYGLVWFTQLIDNTNNHSYTWEIDWAVNWGTSSQPLVPGVQYTSGGQPVDMEPNSQTGINFVTLTYDGDFTMKNPIHSDNVPSGSMQVKTDTSFTVQQSEKMSVAVYMNGSPTFAMQGRPNGTYNFDTHPTYWLCITDSKKGVAVDGNFVSSPTKVEFKDGVTSLAFELNNENQFIPHQD